MSTKGLVSIIMPSYNTSEYIGESIKSVISQTYQEWELIIVDDCSSDNTCRVVEAYLNDTRIQFLTNERNSGAAISRNKALKKAKGKWVAFLDSDDVWLPDKLERQIQYMLENQYYFTYTDYRIQLNGAWQPYIHTGPSVVTKRTLYNYCFFSTITVMYDREYIGLIQIADIKKNNDYAMWFQAIEKAPCYRFPECLSYYIKHDGSVSSGSKFKLIKHFYIMYKIALKKNSFVAVILTINNLIWGFMKQIIYRKKVKNENGNIISKNC